MAKIQPILLVYLFPAKVSWFFLQINPGLVGSNLFRNLKHAQERFLRHFDATDILHPLLAFLLLFK